MELSLGELAQRIDARLEGDADCRVSGCAPLETAGRGEVAFLANRRYARFLAGTEASAVIVSEADAAEVTAEVARLVAADPYFAFREAMVALHGYREHPDVDANHPGGFVHPTATIGAGCRLHPGSVVERGAVVGADTVLYPGAYVGPDAHVGSDCVLFPNAVVYDRCRVGDRVTLHANAVVGHDGFGYATRRGIHHKIPQAGIVIIEDDVEVGAGCAIERAALGATVVGAGTKMADLISIGHGTRIGKHCLLVSLVGISGSVTVGDHVVFGGQAGVVGHIEIGDRVQVAAQAAVVDSVPPDARVGGGVPAIDLQHAKRNALVGRDLFGLARRVKQLERALAKLEANAGGGDDAGS